MKKAVVYLVAFLVANSFLLYPLESRGSSGAPLPTWEIGDFWKYGMAISYSDSQASANLAINANFTVIDTSGDYRLSFSGNVEGSVEVAGIIDGEFQNTVATGSIYVDKSDLAMKRIVVHIEGEIKRMLTVNSFYADVELKQNITSPVSPYDFPIEDGETWVVPTVNMWFDVQGEVNLAVPYEIRYSLPVHIPEHSLTCRGIESVSVDAGMYKDSYHVSDDGGHYEFWYSPSARNTIKAHYENMKLWHNDTTCWTINQMSAWLLETNYPPENAPPESPSNPYPQNNATNVDVDVTLSWECNDVDGDVLTYDIYFGDSSPPPKVKSNQSARHYTPSTLQYSTTYYWCIVAFDGHNHSSSSPIWKFTTMASQNTPPEKPSRPMGPVAGVINQSYTYSSFTTDPDGDDLYYLFDWGDGSTSGWLGPYKSGSMCNASHTWKSMGNYTIKVKAKDVNGGESEWSEGLVVSMPLVHPYATYPLKALASLLYHLLHLLFPLIFP